MVDIYEELIKTSELVEQIIELDIIMVRLRSIHNAEIYQVNVNYVKLVEEMQSLVITRETMHFQILEYANRVRKAYSEVFLKSSTSEE
ncbi:unnamed protein product [Cunninghamella blakesleeana]